MGQDTVEEPIVDAYESETQHEPTTEQSDAQEDTFKDPKVISLNATVGNVGLLHQSKSNALDMSSVLIDTV